jgi:hypothetical protein
MVSPPHGRRSTFRLEIAAVKEDSVNSFALEVFWLNSPHIFYSPSKER